MTSSGSGSYRVGGSLSSSNLSPLAPPFKVDKSLMKSNSTNPSANFSDVHVPLYGACFDPAPGQIWNSSSSSTSVPKCVATESVVTNTNCSSSANMYGYRDSQPSTLPANVYFGSSNGVSGYDPFTYEAFPKRMSSNADEATKPYYPSYVPPPPQKDGYLSLGIGSGPNYDLLSYSGSHLSGFGSAQVGHPQAVSDDGGYKSKWGYSWSGLNESDYERLTDYARNCVSKDVNPQAVSDDGGYKSKWGYSWSGLNESDCERLTDYARNCVSKDVNISNSSSNKSPLFVEGGNKNQPFVDVNVHPFVDGSNRNHLFGDVSNKSHLNQGACVSQDQGLHGQVSSVKDNCFDIFGGAYSLGNLGIDQQDCKSSSKCSRTQNSAFVSASRESPHLQEPVLESVTSFCGSQKGNGSSHDDQFSRASFYMFGSASTASTFPTTMTILPYGGSSSSMESTPLVVKENPMGMDAANQSNTAVGYDFSYQMEPQMPLSLKCQSSIRIRRPASSSRTASSCKIGEVDHRLDDKGGYEQILISPQLPHQLNSDGLNMEASDAVYSVEKHSGGSEGHNPAEDSPCWRGASSSYFSPFEHSESVASDGLLKNLDRCRTLSSQDIQNKSLPLNTFDSKDISSGKLNKATSVEGPSVSACTKDSEDCDYVNPKYHCFDLNAGDSLRFAEDCHASTVDCSMMNKSKADSDSKSSSVEQLILEKEISSASKISEKRGNESSVAAENHSGSPLNIGNLANSLPVNEASIKSAIENSDSNIDVNVLLRTMMSLSEIFRCYCFSNRAEVEKKHSVAIKQIINNLNASMSMVIGQTVPTTVDSSPDTSIQKEFPVVQMVNDAEALAASMKLGRTAEDFLDNVSFEDDRNPFGDVNMTEAVKKLLLENLQEEMDQQKLVYKNLWLEAEASLCVMTAKARFIRMKTEMERARDGSKDKDNPASSNVSANTHSAVELATEAKHSQSIGECPRPPTTSQHNHIEEFNIPNSKVTFSNVTENERSRSKDTCFPSLYVSRPGASGNVSDDPLTASHANDVEACVMARYQILQNRVGCPDSLSYESQQSSGEDKCPSSSFESVNDFHASGTTTKTNDLETSVFGGYRILKCRDDNSDYLNKGQQLPGEENYLPDIDSTSPDKTLQDSQMSNSLGVTDGREASVIARFRILQSRIDHSNSMINDSAPGQQASTVLVEDETGEMGGFKQKPNIKITTFGPYPELAEDEDVNILNIGINEQTFAPIMKANKMNSVIFEGWYDNDCSSSDWEHISQVVV